MNRCCSCRDGLEWTIMTDQQEPKGFLFRVETGLQNLCCAKQTNRKLDFHSGHIFPSSVKTRPEFLFCALTETCPRPKLNLGYLCFLWSGQECCNETMHDIPVCSDMGESFLKTRCVCVSVWHVCTMLGSLFRKDWAYSVCILEMSSWSCGGSVTMEAEMKMMFEWNLCKIY